MKKTHQKLIDSIDKLTKKFSKDNVKEFVKTTFSIDVDEVANTVRETVLGTKNKQGKYEGGFVSNTLNGFKEGFGDIKTWIKGSFSDVAEWLGLTRNSKEQQKNANMKFYSMTIQTSSIL